MPAPFRQACLNCVRAKRRCDLASPSCSRCKSRSLACEYQLDRVSVSEPSIQVPVLNTLSQPEPLIHQVFENERPDNSFDLDSQFNVTYNDFEMDIISFVDHSHDASIPAVTAPSIERRDWMVRDSIDVLTNEENRVRIMHAADRIKLYPKQFAEQGRNTFIHRSLYNSQNSVYIEDASSACALYAARNKSNEHLVFSDLSRKARRLVDRGNQPWTSPMEHLAAVQALILYQTIRLFDGDIRQRADAERDEATLIDWTYQLKSRVRSVRPTPTDPHRQTTDLAHYDSSSWRLWIFDESVRRTVICSFMLIDLYSLLKNGSEPHLEEFGYLTFTAQREMWLAPSEYQWNLARSTRNAFLVGFASWEVDAAGAEASDFEELSVMLVVLMRGKDECSKWLGPENLAKYGLEWHSNE